MKQFISEDQIDTSKPRKTVHDEIFTKHYDGEDRPILVSDLPKDLQPTDLIVYNSDPGHFSENNSWEPYTSIKVLRPRLENDEEYEERHRLSNEFKESLKQRRYETFLKLKEEFEPPNEKIS